MAKKVKRVVFKLDSGAVYLQGREARLRGYERRSPYNDLRASEDWLRGFDEENI